MIPERFVSVARARETLGAEGQPVPVYEQVGWHSRKHKGRCPECDGGWGWDETSGEWVPYCPPWCSSPERLGVSAENARRQLAPCPDCKGHGDRGYADNLCPCRSCRGTGHVNV